ncbi:hypothetical protein OB13_13005 [Pontibacter sp. HJ8]
MKKWLINPVALVLLVLASCQSGPSEAEQQQALEAEVMQLHDKAMADMGKIYRLRRNLATLQDSLTRQPADTAVLSRLHTRIGQLDEADEAMMDWMRHYKPPTNLPHPDAMQYLQEEHTKMKRVKSLMDSTISNAQETYATYGPQ